VARRGRDGGAAWDATDTAGVEVQLVARVECGSRARRVLGLFPHPIPGVDEMWVGVHGLCRQQHDGRVRPPAARHARAVLSGRGERRQRGGPPEASARGRAPGQRQMRVAR
jgi:hypothetical protein